MTHANDNNIPVVKTKAKRGTPLPVTEYRLTINEHDSWSGPDRFYHYYATLEEAIEGKNKELKALREDRLANAGKPTPEYYTTVGDIHQVIRTNDQIFVGKIVG